MALLVLVFIYFICFGFCFGFLFVMGYFTNAAVEVSEVQVMYLKSYHRIYKETKKKLFISGKYLGI